MKLDCSERLAVFSQEKIVRISKATDFRTTKTGHASAWCVLQGANTKVFADEKVVLHCYFDITATVWQFLSITKNISLETLHEVSPEASKWVRSLMTLLLESRVQQLGSRGNKKFG